MYRVLIVEDNADFRQSLSMLLRSRFPSLSIAEANTSKAAMEQIQTFEPNLVFMDINLPDENGFILTRTIKAKHADTTVIIITAYDLPEYRQASFDAGASYFIPKGTLGEEEVLKMVESAMAEPASPL